MRLCFLFCLAVLPVSMGRAEVRVSPLFSDHMVLQQGKKVPVWGTAAPDETVTVEFKSAKVPAQAGADGKWTAILPKMQGGEKGGLKITGSSSPLPIEIRDVVVGEVWICSGQSNMAFPLKESLKGPAAVAAAGNPEIRLFQVAFNPSRKPAEEVEGSWKISSPENAADFSAVAYYFGRDLAAKLKVPVGLIHSSVGGTPAESWTPAKSLEEDKRYAKLLEARERSVSVTDTEVGARIQKIEADWKLKVDPLFEHPSQPDPQWFSSSWSPEGWKEIHLPGMIDKQLGLSTEGSFWVRLSFELPAAQAGEGAMLDLGAVDDFDFTWVNGRAVGQMGRETPDAWNTPRHYKVPAGTLRGGTNVLLLRVIDTFLFGGLTGKESDLVVTTDNGLKIPLAGPAWARLETDIGSKPPLPSKGIQGIAGTLYDGMIAPLIPFAFRGVIWYQGESNADRAVQYRSLFPKMIQEWRKAWGETFPFYFVQIASFGEVEPHAFESRWAELREAQDMSLSLPATGMAVAIDVGESSDIHPRNKETVGERLAALALAQSYGKENPASGPRYKSMKVEGGKIRLDFTGLNGGLMAAPVAATYSVRSSRDETAALVRNSPGSQLEGFAICGKDGVWAWADAKIAGDQVIVWSDKVPAPEAVRYAWSNTPFCNLSNKAGFPAGPFRTDKFPALTENVEF